jgi:hypothetical protein
MNIKVMVTLGVPVRSFDAFGKMVNGSLGANKARNCSAVVAGKLNSILHER